MTPQELKSAHAQCFRNREVLSKSQRCACFQCCTVFPAADITRWTDGEATALCPRCSVDSVIGDASGLAFTPEFLVQMHAYWFEPPEGSP
jgi:hypothetical protein